MVDKSQDEALDEQVDDSPHGAEEENKDINNLSHGLDRSNFLRRFLFFGCALAVIGYSVYLFMPPRKPSFNILEVLSYEALMLERSEDLSRLDFPADDYNQINDYFARYPDLGFVYRGFARLPGQCVPEGATIFDYGKAGKVAVVQFFNANESKRLYFFELAGNLQDLPKSSEMDEGQTHFYAYANDHFNIIAWQKTPETLAFVFGKNSVKKLAALSAASL